MRKQIAAANWKMNLNQQEAQDLLKNILDKLPKLTDNQQVVFSVPAIYIANAVQQIEGISNVFIAAQNCHQNANGAYTGEISAPMYSSVGVNHIVIGHSERREYFAESDTLLAEKVNAVLANNSTPIFCCGEPLAIREAGTQNAFVETQLINSLFHLTPEQLLKVVIAYEPIWAIGTGKTATPENAQEVCLAIRNELRKIGSDEIADNCRILYGGSVKSINTLDIMKEEDVDGALVGGASLDPEEFARISKFHRVLKKA